MILAFAVLNLKYLVFDGLTVDCLERVRDWTSHIPAEQCALFAGVRLNSAAVRSHVGIYVVYFFVYGFAALSNYQQTVAFL